MTLKQRGNSSCPIQKVEILYILWILTWMVSVSARWDAFYMFDKELLQPLLAANSSYHLHISLLCHHFVVVVQILLQKPYISSSRLANKIIFSSHIWRTITGIDMQVRNAQGSTGSNVNVASGQGKRGMVMPFQPLSLAFNHVNYYVDMPVVSRFFFLLHWALYF